MTGVILAQIYINDQTLPHGDVDNDIDTKP